MKKTSRRAFLKQSAFLTGCGIVPQLMRLKTARAAEGAPSRIYVSRNGTPATNMQKAIELAGGITSFVDADDVVVLKPSLQWGNQGYTHTLATKALIDIILSRPGGFSGEIIVAENTHGKEENTDRGWAASSANRTNNWPDMNYNELVAWYGSHGHPNVTPAKLIADNYPVVSGPAGGQGYVNYDYTISNSGGANGRVCRLSYPIIESAYSGKLIDTKYGVWSGGTYTGQNVKLMFLPTLNSHGSRREDYAGATSAVKCHLGFVRSNWNTRDGTNGIHATGYYGTPVYPEAVGEAVGEYITNVIHPTLYLTVAEWAGWGGRTWTGGAENTKTIGVCTNPVALDFWMGKEVLAPSNGGSEASYLDPTNSGTFRKTLEGCHAKGVGTLSESNMIVSLHDYDNPGASDTEKRKEIDRLIKLRREGNATDQDVKEAINRYIGG